MLKNNEELLKYYNDYFNWLPEYETKNPFIVDQEKNGNDTESSIFFNGKIISKLAKEPLEIDVKIPLGFPNEKIVLTTTSLSNYAHLIPNKDESSWFCLNTPFCETIEEQLDLEIERLSGWIDKYLNKGEKHELPPTSYRSSDFTLSYIEIPLKDDEKPRLKKTTWGITDCYEIDNVIYPKDLGNNKSNLMEKYSNLSERKIFWMFSDQKPVKDNGFLPSDIKELNDVLVFPDVFTNMFGKYYGININKHCMEEQKDESSDNETQQCQENSEDQTAQATDLIFADPFNIREDVFLAIGFYFGKSIQWELLKIKCNAIPITVDNKKQRVLALKQYHKKVYFGIEWMKTANINYELFFGRGRLCDKIVNSKIVILGVGAIGSELAEILVRGGLKNIYLLDDDIVEHGNICRSSYQFNNVGESKTIALSNKLISTSPYIDIEQIPIKLYSEINYNSKNELNTFLNQADIIFDCTASNELLHCLSILDLKKPILSLGITNEARDMICITNSKDNLFEQRKFFLQQLEHDTENLFYEGIGCYSPTFKANFADINSLLNLVVKHIDKSFAANGSVDSFILSHYDDGVVKDNIVTFNQKELGFTLSITQHCLNEIEHFSYLHYPYEFGGYLLGGYSRDMKRIYLTNIIMAESKINGRAFFQPIDNSEVHNKITKIFDATNGLINYIGEWHTHPEMGNFYSGTDFDSIRKQAKSNNIFTNNPLLCVVSVGKQFFEPKFYIYYQDDLYEFVK